MILYICFFGSLTTISCSCICKWLNCLQVFIVMNFFCRPPKVSKPPIAKPFFDQNSIVLDFYKGHLDAMIERITQADFSFVMYYAPWDAESQALRNEFESVAQFYHPQVQDWQQYLIHFLTYSLTFALCVLRYSLQPLIVGILIQNAECNIIKFMVIQCWCYIQPENLVSIIEEFAQHHTWSIS